MNKTFILLVILLFGNFSCQNKKKSVFESEKQVEIESNQKVLKALKKEGDKLIVARDVFHWIYFSTEKDQNEYLKEVESKGFLFVSSNKIDDKYPFQLQIKRFDKVDKESVDQYVIYLWQTAINHNGDYDGWETSVEKSL